MFHRLKDGLRAAGLDTDRRARRRQRVSLQPLVPLLEDRRLPSGASGAVAVSGASAAETSTAGMSGGGSLAGYTSSADRFVIGQYQSILQRAPQPREVDYWIGQLDRGLSTGVVHNLIVNSPEAQGVSGGTPSAATGTGASGGSLAGYTSSADRFVIGQYQSILQRAPQPREVDYWAGQVDRGVSRLAVHDLIVNSPEHQAMTGGTGTAAGNPGIGDKGNGASTPGMGGTGTTGTGIGTTGTGIGTTGTGTTGTGTTGTTGTGTTGTGTTGTGTGTTGTGTTGTGTGTTGTGTTGIGSTGTGTTGTGTGTTGTTGIGTTGTGTTGTGLGTGGTGLGTGGTGLGTGGTGLGTGTTGTGLGTGAGTAGTGTIGLGTGTGGTGLGTGIV